MTFEVLMAVVMQISVFCGVTPCGLLKDLSDYLATHRENTEFFNDTLHYHNPKISLK